MSSKSVVLIVEDEHALASALGASVTRLGARPQYAASGAKAIDALAAARPDVIVLDIGLPDMSGLQVLEHCFPEGVDLPVLVVTAHGSLENAIASKRLGVAEYLTKPLDLHAFENVLGGLMSPASGQAAARDVAESGATMIGASQAMQRVFAEVARACASTLPVLIVGASGSGKSLAARVIHANREGRGGLREIECGEADARSIAGACAGMTVGDGLLLENVDQLGAAAQASLLSAIESGGGFSPLSTTRASLHEVVSEGGFREDLYYRLRGIEIRLPSLAERREDIPALANFFLGHAAGERALGIADGTLEVLCEREWQGNVRELRNAIDYAVVACGGRRLLPQHLPPLTREVPEEQLLESSLARWLEFELAESEHLLSYADLLDKVEGAMLKKLLARFDGKPTHLAAELQMNRTTLRKRLDRLGLG